MLTRLWIHSCIVLLLVFTYCLSSSSSLEALANVTQLLVIPSVPSIAYNYTEIKLLRSSSSAQDVQRNSSRPTHMVHIILSFGECCISVCLFGGFYHCSQPMYWSMLPVGERMVPITLVAIQSIIHYSSNPRSLFFHFVLIDMQLNETQLNDFKR